MRNELDSILSCTPRTTGGSLLTGIPASGMPYEGSSMLQRLLFASGKTLSINMR